MGQEVHTILICPYALTNQLSPATCSTREPMPMAKTLVVTQNNTSPSPVTTSGYRYTRHMPLLATPLLLAGLAVALLGQRAVVRGASGSDALMVFGGAVAFFLAGLVLTPRSGFLIWRGPLARPESRRQSAGTALLAESAQAATVPARPRIRAYSAGISLPLAVAAFALSVITFLASGGNQFTPFNVTTWVASVVLALAAFWQPTPQRPRVKDFYARVSAWRAPSGLRIQLPWTAIALAAILALGAFLLFYRIADVPREMTSDHAEKLLDVQDVLDGHHRIFFPRNTGREAFQFYWIALMTPLTGVSYLTMKLGTASLSFMALPFTFLFARVFFGTQLALLATALMAMSRWHLQVARVGLRFPFPPLFGTAIFYFLVKAIRDRRRNDFLLCGLALGLAQHTYTALRLAPLAVLGCLGIALVVDIWRREPPARVRRLVVDSLLMAAISVLTFMPLARYAVEQPQMFLYRGISRMASDSANAPPPDLVGTFLGNVKNAVLMFNWRGDTVWVNNIAGERLLDPVSGALFFLGCVYAVYRLVRYRELPYLYLFVLLFVGLLPSILSLAFPQENPSTVRAGMAIPVVMTIVALPVFLLVRRLARWVGGWAGEMAGAAFLAGLLAVILTTNFDQYFRIYPAQHDRASQHSTHVARAVDGFLAMGGRREDVSILPGAHWFDTRLVAIQLGEPKWQPLIPNIEEVRKRDGTPHPRLYIVHPNDRESLERLSRWYPTAIQHVYRLDSTGGNPWFVTVLIPPHATATAADAGLDLAQW
jgi:hypothetical protein